ncbi:MAG: carboxypeptidase-like regulatory domain-containing protein, partial [Bacteroidota bacterium]
MLKFRQVFLLWLVLAPVAPLIGQESATLFGKIRDDRNAPIEGAAVSIFGAPGGVSTNARGEYSLTVPAGKRIVIIISHISFTNRQQAVTLA